MRAFAAALVEASVVGVESGFPLLAEGDEIWVGDARLRVVRLGGSGLVAEGPGGVLRVELGNGTVECAGLVPDGLGVRLRARAEELADARIVVGAAIVGADGLLAQERGFPAEVAGKWELPGGRVEPGESDVDAVVRECQEELGVRVAVGAQVGVDVPVRADLVLRVYAATVVEGAPVAREHRAVRWVPWDEVPEVDWLPADRVLVPALTRLAG